MNLFAVFGDGLNSQYSPTVKVTETIVDGLACFLVVPDRGLTVILRNLLLLNVSNDVDFDFKE